jgi:hypothetical protein
MKTIFSFLKYPDDSITRPATSVQKSDSNTLQMMASDKEFSTVRTPSPVSTNAVEREAGQPDSGTHRKPSTVLTKVVVATSNVSVFEPSTFLFFFRFQIIDFLQNILFYSIMYT